MARQAESKNDEEITQGFSAEANAHTLRAAFDYRGDVTLTFSDQSQLEGYVSNLSDTSLELWHKGQARKLEIPLARVEHVAFTGKNTASGKSWETWLRKHEAKRAEQSAFGA